jgi:hypothetical protein
MKIDLSRWGTEWFALGSRGIHPSTAAALKRRGLVESRLASSGLCRSCDWRLNHRGESEKSGRFKFALGKTYTLQNGEKIRLVRRDGSMGYETVVDQYGIHRYDRSTHSKDAGRVTGSAHDYSHPENIAR